MKYKPGDKVIVLRNGKVVEDEILWIRGGPSHQYYHTACDDYHTDESVLGHVADGKKVLNEEAVAAHRRDLEAVEKRIQAILDWAESL